MVSKPKLSLFLPFVYAVCHKSSISSILYTTYQPDAPPNTTSDLTLHTQNYTTNIYIYIYLPTSSNLNHNKYRRFSTRTLYKITFPDPGQETARTAKITDESFSLTTIIATYLPTYLPQVNGISDTSHLYKNRQSHQRSPLINLCMQI